MLSMHLVEYMPVLCFTYVSAKGMLGLSFVLQHLPSTLGAWFPRSPRKKLTHKNSKGNTCTQVKSLSRKSLTTVPCPQPPVYLPCSGILLHVPQTSGACLGCQTWCGRSLTPAQSQDPLTRSVSHLEHDKGLGTVTSETQVSPMSTAAATTGLPTLQRAMDVS